MKSRTVLYADPGMVLTDGETFGKQVFLAEDRSADEFHEITEAEAEAIEQERLQAELAAAGITQEV